ncbi:MAG: TatD family deoxyribonuclease [Hyperthermus sp.]|nr:MAG: TatD family deoxyribonuclease [Hyperthermus sp.]
MMEARYVDVHSHAHEYDIGFLSTIVRENRLVIVAVSDDLDSSMKTLRASRLVEDVIPCVGVHPWEVKGRESVSQAERVVEMALREGVKCLGEVGLDTKFVGDTISLQREVFRVFLEASRDHGLILNLHTAGTWEEVLRLLVRYDVGYANFHWYTGPIHLIRDIASLGYTISINPAIAIQAKHRNVVREAPLEIMLTESDAPYKYRGLHLSPTMVSRVVREIAAIKGVEEGHVMETVWSIFKKHWLSRLEVKQPQ